MKRALLLPLWLVIPFLLFGNWARAEFPQDLSVETFVLNPGLASATGMAWAPDGSNRLFVTTKNGTVRVIKDGVLQSTPFAILPQVYTNSECGLIGICFDPDFLNNRFVYFFVTVSATEQRIVRYVDSPGSIGTSPVTLVSGLPTAGSNHDGGAIGIGPDGHLYWAIGDLGNGTGVDADLTSLASKVGRADRFTGQPVSDNPFYDGVGPNNEYIWARGFRNPFTMTFQPRTGNLWLNVAGTGYEQAFLVGRGDHGGYNDYENNQPEGYLEPKIVYRTNGTDTRNITASGATRSGNVLTITTTAAHRFRLGQKIFLSGIADASFPDVVYVASVPSPTTFTAFQAGPDVTSGGGTASTDNIGGSLTGGCFYDSTLLPPEYHGAFFFGDYNSGTLTCAVLGVNNQVTSVDSAPLNLSQCVDVTTGPDGALYTVGVNSGRVTRIAPQVADQKLVVYPTAVQVQEGGRSLFTVRLAKAPAAPVTVTISKRGGSDPNLNTNVGSLVFDQTNWNQLQSVMVESAVDETTAPGVAVFSVSASGIAEYDVHVSKIEGVSPVETISKELLYYTGQQVPGLPDGTVFTSFGLPSVDGDTTGFLAKIKTSGKPFPAIFGGAPLSLLVKRDDPAPDTEGVFSSFQDPVFAGGHYAFLATLKKGGSVKGGNDDGLWSDVSGALRLIAREGVEAPGTNGAIFQSFLSFALPETGGVIFAAKLMPGSGQPGSKAGSASDLGIWREVGGQPVLVLREGDSLSLDEEDPVSVRKIQTLGFIAGSEDQRRSFRRNGDLLILVEVTGGGQAIVKAPGDGSPLTVHALSGDTVTEPSGVKLKQLGIPGAGADTAFLGALESGEGVSVNDDTALFVGNEGSGFSARIREGDVAPDTGGATFTGFSNPAFGSANSSLAFQGQLKKRTGAPAVSSKNDFGLWTNVDGELQLVAREGSVAPGTTGIFARFQSFAMVPDPATSPQLLAFTASLRTGKNGVNKRNNVGLWIRDGYGFVHLLQRTGEKGLFPGNPSAKITQLSALKASPRSAGQGRGMSSDGGIVYRAAFGRSGQGIFRVVVP